MIGYGWLSPCYIHNIYIYIFFIFHAHYIWLVKNSYVPLVQYIRAHPYIPFHSYNSLRSCRSYGSSHGQFTCNRCASSLHISYVHIISLFYDIWLYRIYDILYNIHLIIFISYHIHTCPWYPYSGGLLKHLKTHLFSHWFRPPGAGGVLLFFTTAWPYFLGCWRIHARARAESSSRVSTVRAGGRVCFVHWWRSRRAKMRITYIYIYTYTVYIYIYTHMDTIYIYIYIYVCIYVYLSIYLI